MNHKLAAVIAGIAALVFSIGSDAEAQATQGAGLNGQQMVRLAKLEIHPEHLESFAPLLSAEGGGDTGAPETKNNPIPRDWYHTDWVADRTISWLDSLGDSDDWFCWMSFPDPHHPWDPPQSEVGRIDWRDVPLPDGYPETAAEREKLTR